MTVKTWARRMALGAALLAPMGPAMAQVRELPAIELTPRIMYQLLLGEVALARGQVPLAVQAYAELGRRTRDPRLLQRGTELAIVAKRVDVVRELAQLWQDVEPDAQRPRDILQALDRRTSLTLVELESELARILADSGPNLGDALMRLGSLLARIQDKAQAQGLIERLTAPYLEHPEAWFARAFAAYNSSDVLATQDALDKAISLGPDWEPASLLKAQLLLRQTPQLALDTLQALAARKPLSRDGRSLQATALVRLQRLPEARSVYGALLTEFPDDADLLYDAAMVDERLALYDEMEVRLRHLIGLQPEHAQAHNALGYSLVERNLRLAEARPLVEKARKLAPDDPFILDSYGWLLFREGRLADALQALQQALAMRNDPEIALHVHEVLGVLGRAAEGRQVLEKALREAPDHPGLVDALKKGRH